MGGGKIIDNQAVKDSRIIIVHKKNGGVSSARNAGLDIAKGKFIAFMDSDDYVDSRYLENMINYDSDIVISGVIIGNRAIRPIEETRFNREQYSIFLNEYFDKTYVRAPWAKVFRRDIINEIRFDERIKWGEDYLFLLEILKRSQSVILVPEAAYHYDEPDEIGKYKFTTEDYCIGLLKVEKLLKEFDLVSFKKGTPLETNRLWHFYSMRDYVDRLELTERLGEWKKWIRGRQFRLLPKSSILLWIKCVIEFYRITHR